MRIIGSWVIVLLLLSASGVSADVCAPADPNVSRKENFEKARAVFTARVWKVEESPTNDKIVEGSLRVYEIFKGAPPADLKIRSPASIYGNCKAIPLFAGLDYLIFLRDKPLLSADDGSSPVWNGQAEDLVKELRALAN